MYLPALADHPDGGITMVCGRDADRAAAVAARHGIAGFTDDWRDVVAGCDAVIVASANDTHAEITLAAIAAGRHVLCEKPLALTAADADAMADAAEAAGVVAMTPFTYRWMPAFAWTKQLIDDGFVGRIHHLNLRYFAGYAMGDAYAWRFDRAMAGSGVIGDLGSHWLHVARWWCGEASHVGAVVDIATPRQPRPDGSRYEPTEDSALITLRFGGGGYGSLHVSAAAWEGDGFGQLHAGEIHGSEGTLHVSCDWRTVQEVRGLRNGEPGSPRLLPIPDACWGDARRDQVHDTYRDVFRRGNTMTRQWVASIAAGVPCQPDLREGARVQHLVDAAAASAAAGGGLVAI